MTKVLQRWNSFSFVDKKMGSIFIAPKGHLGDKRAGVCPRQSYGRQMKDNEGDLLFSEIRTFYKLE